MRKLENLLESGEQVAESVPHGPIPQTPDLCVGQGEEVKPIVEQSIDKLAQLVTAFVQKQAQGHYGNGTRLNVLLLIWGLQILRALQIR